MDKINLPLILGIALGVIFIVLAIITIIYIKHSTESRRKKVVEAANLLKDPESEASNNAKKGYWVNKDDLADAADEVSKLRSYHYFDTIDECIMDLIVEMYDCGFVRTEEIFTTAYGYDALTPDSMIFRTDFEEDEAIEYELPPVSEAAQNKIYDKWAKYVNDLFDHIEINTSDRNIATIKDALLVYGRKDISVLLHSPE